MEYIVVHGLIAIVCETNWPLKLKKPKIKPRKAALSFFRYGFALSKPKRTQPHLIPV